MPTACGNPQYGELSGRKESTAAFVQRLLDAGVEFVAKTKTSPFADGLKSACNWYVKVLKP
jgi:Asp-tRNA(Asn)/Glu-tRNA(Gln) amidotransferase A subunit family amidase